MTINGVFAMRAATRGQRCLRSIVISMVAVAACTEPKFDETPASITALGATTVTGVVGTPVAAPLTVVVKNAGGEAIPRASVTFAVTAGGGTLSTTSATTDSLGRASTTWTLGPTAGTQTVTASVAATVTPAVAPVTFTATASAAAASTVTKVAGTDAQSAAAGSTLASPPAVKVADQFGNPIANVLVTFTVTGGGGSVTGASANTGVDGIARAGSWRLGNATGPNTLTATATGLPPVTFTATAVAGAVARVQITNTAPVLTAGQTFQLTAKAFDANNNEVAGAAIGFTSSNAQVATVNATNGTVTAVGPGSATITATAATGGTSATQVISVLGHPSGTLVGTVAGRVSGLAFAGTTVYVAHPFGHEVAFVDATTATTVASLDLVDTPVDLAAPRTGTGPIVVPTTGAMPYLRFVNPTTRLQTDSLLLSAPPVKVAMNAAGTRAFVDMNNFQLAIVDVAARSVLSEVPLAGTVTLMKMGPGDSLLYAATRLGLIYEIRASTGAVRRGFNNPTPVVDFDISPDGRTLFIVDGVASGVTMISLFPGGLSGFVDYLGTVNGVAMSPDGAELWASLPGTVVAAPFENGAFNTSFVNKRYALAGSTPARIVFDQFGSFVAITDNTSNQLIIRR